METDSTLDGQLFTSDGQEVVSESPSTYLLLSFITFGLYELWWVYKIWSHYKEKEALDILPAARAIFSVLFNYSLFEKIKNDATINGVSATYSSGPLFVAWLVLNFCSRLPDPFWFLSFLSIFAFVPILKTFNEAIDAAEEYSLTIRSGLSSGQIVVIILGVLMWILVLAGYLLPGETDVYYDGY